MTFLKSVLYRSSTSRWRYTVLLDDVVTVRFSTPASSSCSATVPRRSGTRSCPSSTACRRNLAPRATHGDALHASATLDLITDVDGDRHAAWLAWPRDNRSASPLRARDAGIAEVAVEVVDDHQGLGIGSALVDAVTTVAAARGVDRVRALLSPDNEASRRLVTRIGIRLQVVDGLLEGEGRLRLLHHRGSTGGASSRWPCTLNEQREAVALAASIVSSRGCQAAADHARSGCVAEPEEPRRPADDPGVPKRRTPRSSPQPQRSADQPRSSPATWCAVRARRSSGRRRGRRWDR